MKKVAYLNAEEKRKLNHRLLYLNRSIKWYLKRQIKVGILGILFVAFIYFFKDKEANVTFLLTLLFTGMVVIPLTGILYQISRKDTQKLSVDIKKNKKIIEKATIVSINKFTRKMRLSNQTYLYILPEVRKSLKVGDLISYKVSYTYSYVFECVKV